MLSLDRLGPSRDGEKRGEIQGYSLAIASEISSSYIRQAQKTPSYSDLVLITWRELV